jgi:hypothetical protein
MRGFDCYAIDVKGAVPDSALTEIVSAQDTAVYFNGIEGSEVIIDNDSVEAIALANAMLTDGAKVGFVTQGEYIADFVVSYDTYLQYRDGFVVKATGVESAPDAKLLRPAPIYIPGFAGDFSMDSSGKPYGAFNFPNYGNTNYNFDRFAYGTQMGFEIVGDPASALMIVGNRALDGGAIEEVKAGKPYLAAGAGALATVKSELLGQYGFDYTANNPIQDALYFVSFGGGSLTTAGYERRGDNLLYSYGGAYISGVPADADVLLTATDDTPLEGFMIQEDLDEYLGAVQAIAYTSNGLDVTVFAGSLTNKAHQQDDYQYAANTIFAKTMYGDYSASVFDDIDGHSDYDAIMYVYSNSLLVGTGAKKFSPDLAMNRAMAVTVLGRAAGVDVSEYAGGAYYAPYANWAAQSDIIAVADGGLFAPDASVTRQELAVVLLRYMDFMGDEYVVTEEYILFADEGDIADYAKSAVQIIYKLGLIDAADNNFAPNAAVTRAQMASILQRYLSD